MPRELIQKYLNNPFILAGAAAAAVFIFVIIIVFFVRRSRRKAVEAEWAAELERREHQAAVDAQPEPTPMETAMRRTAPLDPSSQKLLKFASRLIDNVGAADSLSKVSAAVAELIGADSAALWRVDSGAGMVKESREACFFLNRG